MNLTDRQLEDIGTANWKALLDRMDFTDASTVCFAMQMQLVSHLIKNYSYVKAVAYCLGVGPRLQAYAQRMQAEYEKQ